jgi:hypothetical protein
LSDISWAFEPRHLIIIHELFNIDGPPLLIDLLEWNQWLCSTVNLRGVSLTKCDIWSLTFLGETECSNRLIYYSLIFHVLH